MGRSMTAFMPAMDSLVLLVAGDGASGRFSRAFYGEGGPDGSVCGRGILLLAVQKDHRPDARPLSDALLTVYAVNIFSAVGPRTAAFVVSRSGTFIGCGTEAPAYIADDR